MVSVKKRTRINHKHSNHKVDLKTRQETLKKSSGSDCDELVDYDGNVVSEPLVSVEAVVWGENAARTGGCKFAPSRRIV